MAYLDVGLNFRYNLRFKNAPEHPNAGHFENFEIFEIDSFLTQDMERTSQIIT